MKKDFALHVNVLISSILELLERKNLVVFGDSHSQTFKNLHSCQVFHIGPVTAYNLAIENSSTKGREKVLSHLSKLDPSETALVLVFGEIDCRMHIVKSSSSKRTSIYDATQVTANRYFSFIQEILSIGFTVLVYGPAGSGSASHPNYPLTGREVERNYAIHVLNKFLQQRCKEKGVYFTSVDDVVINKTTWRTRMAFLEDGCHLNTFPDTSPDLQAIVLSRFLKNIQETKLLGQDDLIHSYQRLNHAEGKLFSLSSSWRSFPLQGFVRQLAPFFFHTDSGENQTIRIDLSSLFYIDQIVLWNRTDICQGRAKDLKYKLYSGKELVLQGEIKCSNEFLTGEMPSLSIRFKPVLARYVEIYSTANTYLHFSWIQVIGDYPLMTFK